ncbi:hypothetical protein [Fischerella sp. PCC 9605]|uniref:hypothetical protein n=1 Tax=Fischerella sp. PCC 9605 TaxID=1173024 RepID=UPI0012DD795B|nr:hypothetical protein [Fischerella sp. PCC 9605]
MPEAYTDPKGGVDSSHTPTLTDNLEITLRFSSSAPARPLNRLLGLLAPSAACLTRQRTYGNE